MRTSIKVFWLVLVFALEIYIQVSSEIFSELSYKIGIAFFSLCG